MTEAESFLKDNGIDTAAMNGRNWFNVEDYMRSFKVRDQYIARFGFAILTQGTVAAMVKFSPILEIGCGSGYWAHELRKAGADCIATDPGTGKYGPLANGWKPYVADIEPLDGVAAVVEYPNRALLTVWPDYDAPWVGEALRAFQGSTVLYVGEGQGGCTGDDAFHEYLETHYLLTEEIDIPQFSGIHDRLEVYKRLPI